MNNDKEPKGLSRRAFLKNTGLSVAAATAGAGFLGPQAVAAQDATPSMMTAELAAQKWSFEVPPDPIPDSEITNTVEADIVIVGAGIAGMVAATSAIENGARVVLISASSAPVYRGGSFQAARSRYMDDQGIEPYDVDKFFRRELSAAGYNVDQTKWWKFYNNSEEAINWLTEKMEAAGYETVLEDSNHAGDLSEPMFQPPASHCWLSERMRRGGMAAEFVAKTLQDSATAAGVDFHFQVVAKQLVRDDNNTGRVTAVIAQEQDGAYTRYVGVKAVILATGDFSNNPEMMAKYCPQAVPLLDNRGDRGYDNGLKTGGLFYGDGQKMGMWVGAAWQKAPNPPMILTRAGAANKAYNGHSGLVVNKNGIRFGNENINFAFAAYTQMHQPEKKAYAIWGTNYAQDAAPWPPADGVLGSAPATPEEMIAQWDASVEQASFEQGAYAKADTIEALIEAMGLPLEATKATIDHYNALCASGDDADFHKSPELMIPISEGPFYGAASNLLFLTVMGGLRTNVNMQVCDENDVAIPGLYNLGTMVGDFFSTMYTFRVEGNNLGANCLTFGYVTGRDIANGTLA